MFNFAGKGVQFQTETLFNLSGQTVQFDPAYSLYSRARSKSVELLVKVYDHVDHRFVKGFRLLTLGWSEGNSFIPLAFSLLNSEKKENRLVDCSVDIDKRCHGYKRRVEATQNSTDVLIRLLQQAKDYGFTAKHVLFDSWFAFPSVLKSDFTRLRWLKTHLRFFTSSMAS